MDKSAKSRFPMFLLRSVQGIRIFFCKFALFLRTCCVLLLQFILCSKIPRKIHYLLLVFLNAFRIMFTNNKEIY